MSKEKRFENLSFFEAVGYAKNNGMKLIRSGWNEDELYIHYDKEINTCYLIYQTTEKPYYPTIRSIEAQDWIAFN